MILHQPSGPKPVAAIRSGGILHALARIAGAFLGLVLFAAAFVFTSLLLAAAAVGALTLWGWVLWRTRRSRKAAGRTAQPVQGVVIEGEYVVRDEESDDANLPRR